MEPATRRGREELLKVSLRDKAERDGPEAARNDVALAYRPSYTASAFKYFRSGYWNKTRVLAAADRLLSNDGDNASTRTLALLFTLVACSISFLLGLPHTSMYGHDIFILLDGGWRVLAGQRAHVDFYSAFGPVAYLIAATGLWLAKFRVVGILYATVIVGILLGTWSALLTSARLKAWSCILLTSFLVLFWLAPFPLGEPYYLSSYAMQYNRLGYVLVALVLVEVLVPNASGRAQSVFSWGGVSTGVILALLLFLKISFFFVALVLVAISFLLFRRSLRYTLSLVVSASLLCAILLAYLHWDVGAIWRDLQIAAHARATRFHSSGDPFRTIFRNLVEIATLTGFALLALLLPGQAKAARTAWTAKRLAIFVVLILGADLLLAIGNTQRSGFPLSLVATLILSNVVCSRYVDVSDRSRDLYLHGSIIVSFATLLVLLPYMTDTANSWGILLMRDLARRSTIPTARLESAPLEALTLDDHSDPAADLAANNGTELVEKVNEGLFLVRSHSTQSQSIACLCFSNPFSYALLRKPPLGGSTFYAYGTNFTIQFSPSAARILGNADLVIYPNQKVGDDGVDALLQICGPILASHYRLLAHSEHWTLLEKI